MLLSMTLVACQNKYKTPQVFEDYKANPYVEESIKEINNVRSELSDSTAIIEGKTTEIRSSLLEIEDIIASSQPPVDITSNAQEIRESSDEIDKQALIIKDQEEKLEKVQEGLMSASARIKQMERHVQEFQTAAEKAEKEKQKAIKSAEEAERKAKNASRSMLKWLILVCTVGGGAGIAIMVFGNFSMGGMIAVASGCVLFFAIAVEQYFNFIAYGGVALILLTIAYLIYMVVIRDKAVEEVVHTAEMAKGKLQPEERKEIFGYKEDVGKVHTIQSKSTNKLVANVRERFRASWGHTIPEDGKIMDERFRKN